jgi:hypothetical protein
LLYLFAFFSAGHCIVCLSPITASDYLFGIYKLFCLLF